MKRILLILFAILGGLMMANAQEQTEYQDLFGDEKDHRPLASGEVTGGMKYKEYKKFYNTGDYFYEPDDEYSPDLAGLMSLLVSGLGQCYVGEWGRGIGIFSVQFGLSTILLGSVAAAATYSDDMPGGTGAGTGALLLAAGAVVGKTVLYVWNIFDAVQVAKVKNMYLRDIRSQRSGLDVKIEPYLAYKPASLTGDWQPAAGLSFKVNF